MLLVDVTAPSRHDPIAVAARLAVDSFEGAGQGGVGQGGGGQASGGSSLPLFLKNQGVAHSNACVVQQILSLRQPLQLVPWRTAQVGHCSLPGFHHNYCPLPLLTTWVSITTTAHYHCSLPGIHHNCYSLPAPHSEPHSALAAPYRPPRTLQDRIHIAHHAHCRIGSISPTTHTAGSDPPRTLQDRIHGSSQSMFNVSLANLHASLTVVLHSMSVRSATPDEPGTAATCTQHGLSSRSPCNHHAISMQSACG